ncbi:DUF485 domain-containing protein [Streptomyces griseorubiginosus]|uniref:DUF485 domain-containing protein n=1 Tax=Streptomyces griseorubiginosus TaxID=67304 RepID=A0AAI8L9A0_9ACTN|nr:DUF485 domain-containing protein [Streptomyces griseorubiginosus]AYC43720.1 hypothetical protein DWG14_08028 [Streptomyces griseorubiginosus]
MSGLPAYQELRRTHRRFGVRATAVAVGGFLLYVLLSSFLPGLMNTSVSGHLTVGLALGFGQFVLMSLIVWRYLVHVRTDVTPVVRGLRGLARHQENARRRHGALQERTTRRGAFEERASQRGAFEERTSQRGAFEERTSQRGAFEERTSRRGAEFRPW